MTKCPSAVMSQVPMPKCPWCQNILLSECLCVGTSRGPISKRAKTSTEMKCLCQNVRCRNNAKPVHHVTLYHVRNDPFIAKSSDGTKCFSSECMRWEDNFHIPMYLQGLPTRSAPNKTLIRPSKMHF